MVELLLSVLLQSSLYCGSAFYVICPLGTSGWYAAVLLPFPVPRVPRDGLSQPSIV